MLQSAGMHMLADGTCQAAVPDCLSHSALILPASNDILEVTYHVR